LCHIKMELNFSFCNLMLDSASYEVCEALPPSISGSIGPLSSHILFSPKPQIPLRRRRSTDRKSVGTIFSLRRSFRLMVIHSTRVVSKDVAINSDTRVRRIHG